MHKLSPKEHYQQALQHDFIKDEKQAFAVELLQDCFHALHHNEPCKGVYLWGPVGRGKTWLMDSFFNSLSVPAKRMHFHHFVAFLHRRLFQLSGQLNPLDAIAQELVAEIKVLCFDEFFINDIGDAMLLGPLMQKLFDHGLVLVATSNEAPENLYLNGFNRERLLPALNAIINNTTCLHLDGEQDHRLHGEITLQRYFVKDDKKSNFAELFQELSGEAAIAQDITLSGRAIRCLGLSSNIIWFDYNTLCNSHRSAMDYMDLCQQYRTILLSDVPNLNAPPKQQFIARGTEDAVERVIAGDRKLMAISSMDNSVRRFIALVDECYEQNVPLYIEAELPLEQLYTEGALLFPFKRTRSRLEAMQRQQQNLM